MSDRARDLVVPKNVLRAGDIYLGSFVRLLTGSSLGMVEHIDGDHATVLEFGAAEPCRSIVACALLIPVVDM